LKWTIDEVEIISQAEEAASSQTAAMPDIGGQ